MFLLSNPGTALFADPGTGKTAITLMVLDELKRRGCLETPILILSTLRIAQIVWPEEIHKWDQFNHFTYAVIHGSKKTFRVGDAVDIHLVNNEGLAWLAKSGHLRKYRTLILDESSKYKNPNTQRTRLLASAVSQFYRRHILTGTPRPTSYLDLFSQMYIADTGKSLGTKFPVFRHHYFYNLNYLIRNWVEKIQDQSPRKLTNWEIEDLSKGVFPVDLDEKKQKFLESYSRARYFGNATKLRYIDDWRLREGAAEAIDAAVAPSCYRLDGERLLNLPKVIDNEIRVDIPPKYARLSTRAIEEFLRSPEGFVSKYSMAREMAGGVCDEGVVHDAKINALREVIDSAQGGPVFVLFFFRAEGKALSKIFDAPLLYGGLSAGYVQDVCTRWNKGEIPILFAQYQTVSHGLNLQGSACHHIVHYTLTDVPDDYDQSIKRIRRQGNSASVVFNHLILARNTPIDYGILDGLRNCLAGQQNFLESIYKRVFND